MRLLIHLNVVLLRQNYIFFMKLQRKTNINYIESVTFNRVKRYVKNLLLALIGYNPYQMEMDQARNHLERAAEDLKAAQDMCYATMERWNESHRQLTQMQQLVETLRDHLREKDEQVEQLRREYIDCIERMKRDYEKHQNEG